MLRNIKSPSKIDGIKRLAKTIKKEQQLSHARALDYAAKLSGYENYKHALHALTPFQTATEISPKPIHAFAGEITLSADWGEPGELIQRETLAIKFARTPSEWLDVRSRRAVLGPFRSKGANHYLNNYIEGSQSVARWSVCRVARYLQFMEATDLMQVSESKIQLLNAHTLPGIDHSRYWKHRTTGAEFLTDEPYLTFESNKHRERKAWAERNGLIIAHSPWAGMHNPIGAPLFLLTTKENHFVLNTILKRLVKLSRPVTEKMWNAAPTNCMTTSAILKRRVPLEEES